MLRASCAGSLTGIVSGMGAQGILRSSVGAALACLFYLFGQTSASSDETAVRAKEGLSWSNVAFHAELEGTNPALLKATSDKWAAEEQQLITNGFRDIPCLRQFTALFPKNVHFRSFSLEKPQLWTLQTGLYDRYMLRMEVLFTVDSTWTNIVNYEPPSVNLITYDDNPPNNRGFSEGRVVSRRLLSSSDWDRLVAARGDITALGFLARDQ